MFRHTKGEDQCKYSINVSSTAAVAPSAAEIPYAAAKAGITAMTMGAAQLMIKYGIGVFNPGYEMTVRYYLLSQLYLETVSGSLSQSLDIYYSFDID